MVVVSFQLQNRASLRSRERRRASGGEVATAGEVGSGGRGGAWWWMLARWAEKNPKLPTATSLKSKRKIDKTKLIYK